MPDKKAFYRQTRTYELIVKIKNLDYTADVTRVSVYSSLATGYQVVTFLIQIDPNDVILEDMFGKEPIKLTMNLLSGESVPSEGIELELMYLKADLPLTEKGTLSQDVQKDRVPILITTVTRQSYKTLMTLVNGVYIGQTLNQIVNDLATQAGATVKYETDNQNTTVIDQVCVPPTTFYKAIKESNRQNPDAFDGYLDQRFGLFNGVAGVFSQFDNIVHIKNLTRKLQKKQAFTIYQLGSEGGAKNKEIVEDSVDGKTFYTYDKIETDYSGNAKFAVLASTLNHIVKPKNTLAAILQQNLKSVAQNYSLTFKNNAIQLDPSVERTRFYNEDTGYETESTIFNSRFGRTMADLSTLSLRVERDLPVLNLLDVGEAVTFKPQTIEYGELSGKYILFSSALNFERRGDWASVATVNLIRTNRKI